MAWFKHFTTVTAVGFLFESALAFSSEAKDVASEMKIFMAECDWHLSYKTSDEEELLLAPELFQFEKTSSSHFHKLLSASENISQRILLTNVNIQDETISENFKTTFRSSIVVMYAGGGPIEDLQGALSQLVNRDQSERLMEALVKNGVASTYFSKILVSAFSQPTVLTMHEAVDDWGVLESEETLSAGRSPIVLVCFGLAFLLLLVSLVLFWVGGTFSLCLCTNRRKEDSPYQPRSEKYTRESLENDAKIQGVLGAEPVGEDENAPPPGDTHDNLEAAAPATGLTPRKSVYRRYEIETPASVLTPVSVNTSMVSRAPLGITSVRKLNRFGTPQKENKEKPLYDLPRALT